jgi:hypothetical protein
MSDNLLTCSKKKLEIAFLKPHHLCMPDQMFKERGELKQKHTNAKVRDDTDAMLSIDEDVAALDARIDRARQSLELQPVCAFVTFEDEHTRNRLLREYPSSWLARLCCICCVQERFRFGGSHLFRLSPAPDASNIIFHNLAFTPASKHLRRVFTALMMVVALAVSFAIIFVAAWQKQQIPASDACPTTTILFNQTQATPSLLGCYCLQEFTQNFRTSLFEGDCFSWFKTYSISQGLLYGSGIVIAVTNNILIWLVNKLVLMEKHSSMTNEQTAIMIKMFVAMFINTAVINLVVSADFSGFGFDLFKGQYPDFTPAWYV